MAWWFIPLLVLCSIVGGIVGAEVGWRLARWFG